MRVAILFLGDPSFDSRTTRFAESLRDAKCDVFILGVRSSGSPVQKIRNQFLLRLVFHSGPLRFFEYFLRSFFALLLRERFHMVLSADLYSLPAGFLLALFHHSKLIYDSRELYSATAALASRPFVQRFWRGVERFLAPRCDVVLTVNNSIAEILRASLHHAVAVVRNVPKYLDTRSGATEESLRVHLGIEAEIPILLYQGGLQQGRGLFIMLDIAERLSEAACVFLGSGPLRDSLAREIRVRGLQQRAFILNAIPVSKLLKFTSGATLGISLIENRGKSYFLSLPNKVFEYIMAGVPVIASNFPEMRLLIEKYQVGIVADPEDIAMTVQKIRELLSSPCKLKELKENCFRAAMELNWEKESALFLNAIGMQHL